MSLKLFLSSSNEVYDASGTVVSPDWTTLTDVAKESLFTTHGSTDTTFTTFPTGTYRILVYSTVAAATHTCGMTAVPLRQTILPSGLISIKKYSSVTNVSVTHTMTGSSDIRIGVTNDLTHYYKYSSGSWVSITNIGDGMTPTELATVTDWSNFQSSIGFAYSLDMTASTETCNVDALILTVNMKGSWNHCTDATYGYVGNETLSVTLNTSGDYKINYNG